MNRTLTPTQLRVVHLLANDATPVQIEQLMDISRHTLRTHRQDILRRLAVHSMAGAVAVAFRRGWIA